MAGLLTEAIRISKKKVFVLTPSRFFNNADSVNNKYSYVEFDGKNEFQRHHLFVSKKFLRQHGFKTRRKGIHRLAVKVIA